MNNNYKIFTLFCKIFLWVWVCIICIGVSLPGKEIPKVGFFENIDKVVHFTFFFILCLLYFLAYGTSVMHIFFIVVATILFGFDIEFYQKYYVTGRSFDVWDGLADSVGTLCSLFFINKVNKIKQTYFV